MYKITFLKQNEKSLAAHSKTSVAHRLRDTDLRGHSNTHTFGTCSQSKKKFSVYENENYIFKIIQQIFLVHKSVTDFCKSTCHPELGSRWILSR